MVIESWRDKIRVLQEFVKVGLIFGKIFVNKLVSEIFKVFVIVILNTSKTVGTLREIMSNLFIIIFIFLVFSRIFNLFVFFDFILLFFKFTWEEN